MTITTVWCSQVQLLFSAAYVKQFVNYIIFVYKLQWADIEVKFSTQSNWHYPQGKRKICANSIWAQNAGLWNWIRTASLDAKIFRSVFCNKGLRHEMESIVCLIVIKCSWPRGDDMNNYSPCFVIDLVDLFGMYSDIRFENLRSLPPL